MANLVRPVKKQIPIHGPNPRATGSRLHGPSYGPDSMPDGQPGMPSVPKVKTASGRGKGSKTGLQSEMDDSVAPAKVRGSKDYKGLMSRLQRGR